MRATTIALALAATALARDAGAQQGHLRWPASTQQVRAWIIQTDSGTTGVYELFFPGFSTIVSAAGDGGENQGTALDAPTEVRTVSGVEFVEENTGSTLQEVPLFAFSRNGNVPSTLPPAVGTWWGFHAAVNGEIPEFEPGALVFTVESNVGLASLRSALVGSRAVVTVTDANGFPSNPQLQWIVTAADVQPARVLYYKFDRGEGDIAFNYGGFPGAPRIGTIATNETGSPWTGSQFGSALRGGDLQNGKHTRCDTGWIGGLHGSFSLAWFMRQRVSAPGAQVSAVFSGPGGFRCFTGGQAGSGLRCEGWGGSVDLPTNIQAAAAGGWVHVALVVDASLPTPLARWYVDGALAHTAPTAAAAIDEDPARPLVIGGGSAATASAYDLDEFRLWAQAVGDSVVDGWSKAPDSAATSLGSSCSANLRHTGGAPAPGAPFDLVLEGVGGRPAALLLGARQLVTPFDLGTLFPNLQGQGCLLYGGFDVSVSLATNPNGLARLTIQIPQPVPPFQLYSQGIVLDTARLTVSNAHAASVR